MHKRLFEVRESSIDNKGVFAVNFIPKDTRLIEYTGEHVRGDEEILKCLKRDASNGRHYVFDLNGDVCVDGLIGGSDAIYFNHSCSPNCEYDIIDGHIWISSLRDIAPGEELTYDYCFTDPVPYGIPVDKCLCGSPHCRGFILSEDALAVHLVRLKKQGKK
jgi:SET domain-containing protein